MTWHAETCYDIRELRAQMRMLFGREPIQLTLAHTRLLNLAEAR